MSASEPSGPDPRRLLSPLRASRAYRLLFTGQLTSQVAIWILTVAAQVILVQQGQSTLVIALVQTAVTLPFLIITIPSGVLADLVSRRGVLVTTNSAAAALSATLVIVSAAQGLPAWLLLSLTLLLGMAWAINAPTYSAAVPDVVDRSYIPMASMLSSINFNIARVIGPALGGIAIALLGATWAFGLSVLGFAWFGVAAFLADIPRRTSASRRFGPALRTGFRHVINSASLIRIIIVTAAWFIAGAVMWALLPVVAMRELGIDSGGYGWILALVGGGAVVGTILMAPLRSRLLPSRFTSIMVAAYALSLVGIGLAHRPWILMLVLPIAGASWTATGAVLLAQAQQMLPAWVRARGMAYYLMASQGGLAAGSLLWGALGGVIGIPAAFISAAVALGVILWMTIRGGLPDVALAEPGDGWPLPDAELTQEQLDRKARILVVWRVPPEHREEFLTAMIEVRRSRRRTGGRGWTLSWDVDDPSLYAESWTVDSWHDHLEQHEVRQATADMQASAAVRALVGEPVAIRHYVDAME